jgi:hypothetical protein
MRPARGFFYGDTEMPNEEPGELTGVAAAELITGAPAAGEPPAAEETDKEKAFQAMAEDERAKRQALEEDNRRLQEQLLAVANPPQVPQAPADVFEGMEGFENITVDQARQLRQENVQNTQQLLTNIQVNNFISAKTDFSEIVGTYGPRGLNSAQALKDLIKDNPQMRVLENLPATAAPYVYQVVKQHKELKELKAQQNANNEHQAGVNVANRTGPLSPAALGGGGGAPSGDPTDAQVDEVFDKALAGDFG